MRPGITVVYSSAASAWSLKKRYDVMASGDAINEYLRTEVPNLGSLFSAFSLGQDKGRSAVKQPLEGAHGIFRVGVYGLIVCSVIVAFSDKKVCMGKPLPSYNLRRSYRSLRTNGHFLEDTGFGAENLVKEKCPSRYCWPGQRQVFCYQLRGSASQSKVWNSKP